MKQTYSTCSQNHGVFDSKKPCPALRTLVLSLAMSSFTAQAIATNYTMIDLNAVPSGGISVYGATAIDNSGKVVGNGYNPLNLTIPNMMPRTPLMYDPATGSMTDIQLMSNGGHLLTAQASNNLGQTVGIGSMGNPTGIFHSILRNTDGSAVDIGTLPGHFSSYAMSINDIGQVAGISHTLSTQARDTSRAYIWSAADGGMQALGSLAGPNGWSEAYGINAGGQAVGLSNYTGICTASDGHAFVSTPTGPKDLHSPNMPVDPMYGCGTSVATQINDSGMAVGVHINSWTAARSKVSHATVWDTATGAYTDLSKGINPMTSQVLTAINASGQVVGSEATFNGILYNNSWEGTVPGSQHALVGDIKGGLTDLNQVIINKPTGWVFEKAIDINDVGQIIANARDTASVIHVVLLTPQSTSVSIPPTIAVIPATPSTLVAAATSSSQINLTWTDNANNETAQYVERCAGASCTNFVQVASLAANVTSYNDTGLTAATSYSYRVRAHGATADSAYSNAATVSTSAPAPAINVAPVAPGNLSSSVQSTNQIVLSWVDNATNELSYLIERCKGASCTTFSQVASVGANVTGYANSRLRRNTSYNYRVRATNATGNSAYSNTLSVRTLP